MRRDGQKRFRISGLSFAGVGILWVGILLSGMTAGGCDASFVSAVQEAMVSTSNGLIQGAFGELAAYYTEPDNITATETPATDNATSQ